MHRRWTLATGVAVAVASCVAGDGPATGGEPPLWTASVDLRIGSVDGPGPVFGRIHGMGATPEGGILVIDGQAAHVAEFDAWGELVRRFGGPGAGPGEFMTPAYVGIVHDTVWVSDEGLRRVSYFTREGELVRTVTLNRSDVEPPRRLHPPLGPVGERRWVSRIAMGSTNMVDAGVERLPIVTVDELSRVRDTLAFRRVLSTAFVARNPDHPGGAFVTRQPFENATHWVIRPGGAGILTAEQVDGERSLVVSHIAPTGDTVWSERYPYRPVELSEEHLRPVRADLLESIMASRGLGAETEADAERILDEALYAPEYLPTVTGLVMANDTDFYVRREEAAPGQPQRWTFFTDREPAADVHVPHGIRVYAAHEGALWGLMTDELDVPYVVRMRVQES